MHVIDYLKKAVEEKASDIFFLAGSPATAKVEGRIIKIGEERLLPNSTKELITEIYELAKRSVMHFEDSGDDDFSFALPGVARFRVNAYRQRGSWAAVIRTVAFTIPDWREYNIPEEVMKLAEVTSGMILVTGTAVAAEIPGAFPEITEYEFTQTTACCAVECHLPETFVITFPDNSDFFLGKSAVLMTVFDEKFIGTHIGLAVEKDTSCGRTVTSRTSCLLIIAFDILRHIVVNNKGNVGLVYTHTEGICGNHNSHLALYPLILTDRTLLGR